VANFRSIRSGSAKVALTGADSRDYLVSEVTGTALSLEMEFSERPAGDRKPTDGPEIFAALAARRSREGKISGIRHERESPLELRERRLNVDERHVRLPCRVAEHGKGKGK